MKKMNIAKILNNLSTEYANQMQQVKIAYDIYKRICKFIPEGWECQYVTTWKGLLISSSSTTNLKRDWNNDLRIIRSYLKTMFPKKKWDIKAWTSDEYLFCLHISEHIKINSLITLPIEVRQFNTKECKVEIVEELTKKVKVIGDCGEMLAQT